MALAVLLSVVPPVGVLLAAGSDPAYDQVGLTAVLAGVRTDGTVGASGGLVTLDSGSAYVTASLDASPSAAVLAAPYEPGTLARTAAGTVNGSAGQKVLAVPDAEARYPGTQTSGSCCGAPAVSQDPLLLGAAQAHAEAAPGRVAGAASGASYALKGVLEAGASTSTVTMTSDTSAGRVVQQARTSVGRVVVAGVLELDDVVATARITTDRDRRTAEQSLTIGGARVAGQPVEVGNDGVQAAGTPLLPGTTLSQATEQADAQLAAAGISVHTVGGRTTRDGRSASADTGGVQVTLRTPDLPGGVAANVLTVVVGSVVLTESDTAFVPEVQVPAQAPGATVVAGRPLTTTTTTIPGTAGTAALPAAAGPAPQVALPVVPRAFVVGGRRYSARTALLAFAVWQVLSLGTATLYAFVERRRRLGPA